MSGSSAGFVEIEQYGGECGPCGLFKGVSVYSAVAAPIAILLWSYITAVAVLLGACVTVTLRGMGYAGAEVPDGSESPALRHNGTS